MVKELIESRMSDIVALKKGAEPGAPMRPVVEAYRGDRLIAVTFVAQRDQLENIIDLTRGYLPTSIVIGIDANFTSLEHGADAAHVRDEKGNLDPASPDVEEAVILLAVAKHEHLGKAAPYWTDEFGNLWFMEPFELGNKAESPMLNAAMGAVRYANAPVPEDIVQRDCETTVGILRSGSPAMLFSEEGRGEEAEQLLTSMIEEIPGAQLFRGEEEA